MSFSRGRMTGGYGHTSRRPRSPSPEYRSFHRDRSPPFRRRRLPELPYRIPTAAPRLPVPPDLPLDATVLLDLIAFFVAQGGPTTEEEIMKREENNPHFAFLHAPWRDPMQVYYRWRLYSLLQGDTLLKWRTEPFQVVRGSEAYVWIPPPAIASGPECLLELFAPQTREARVGLAEERCVPTASWLSRVSVSEGMFFVTLEKDAAVEWQRLLDMDDHIAQCNSQQAQQQPHPGDAEERLEERVHAASAVWLGAERVSQRMVFTIEHQHAALHVMSLLLDEMVSLARQAARLTHENPTNTENPTSAMDKAFEAALRCVKCLSLLFTLNDIGRNAASVPLTEDQISIMAQAVDEAGGLGMSPSGGGGGGLGNTTTSARTATPASSEGASLLSISVPPSGPSATATMASSIAATTTTTTTATMASGRLLSRAIEKIIPTLVEAALIIALCTAQQYGALQVDNARDTDRSSAKPPGAEETEGILPLDIDQAAYVHVQTKVAVNHNTPSATALRKEDRDAVCMIAMLLISWLKQLCTSWADNDVIGNRCWGTLITKYAFLFSQPIETT